MANKITAFLDLNVSKFNAGVKSAGQSIREAEGPINKVKAGWKGALSEFTRSPLAIGAATASVGALAGKAISAASDLEESVNAVNVTFGDAADGVLALGENSAKSFGLAKSEFNQLAVQFSAFAKNIAAGTGQGVDTVLGDLTTRVADFASVMNLDLATATQVFMSTLAGETEPIRKFGKDISAAAVEAFALSEGLISNKNELTESIKVQARFGLLMRETADTAGDFRNTSDSLANSQRILQAQAKDLAADIGKDLMPAMQGLVTAMISLVDVADKLKLTDALGFLDDIDNLGTGIGRALRAPFDDLAVANQQLVAEFNASQQAAADFDLTLLDGLRTFDQVRAKVLELTDDQHAANLIALEWKRTAEGGADAAGELADAVGVTAEAFDELKAAADPAWDRYIASQASALAAAEGAPGTFADLEAAAEGVGDAFDEAAEIGIERFQQAIEDAKTAITEQWSNFDEELDIGQQVDDIAEQFERVTEAQSKLAEGGEAEAREYRSEVRRLILMVADFAEEIEDLPPQKITEIQAKLASGDIEQIQSVFDELTKDRFVRVNVVVPDVNNAYDSINTRIGNGTPGPIFNNPNPAPTIGTPGGGGVSAQNITINTLTSSPAKQYVDRQIDDRRNGVR